MKSKTLSQSHVENHSIQSKPTEIPFLAKEKGTWGEVQKNQVQDSRCPCPVDNPCKDMWSAANKTSSITVWHPRILLKICCMQCLCNWPQLLNLQSTTTAGVKPQHGPRPQAYIYILIRQDISRTQRSIYRSLAKGQSWRQDFLGNVLGWRSPGVWSLLLD